MAPGAAKVPGADSLTQSLIQGGTEVKPAPMMKARPRARQQEWCPREGCNRKSSSKSRKGYCRQCLAELGSKRSAWRAFIAGKAEGDRIRREKYKELYDSAMRLPEAAPIPTPSTVSFVDDIIGDTNLGFASIVISPGFRGFPLWMRRCKMAENCFGGGVVIRSDHYGQPFTVLRARAIADHIKAGMLELNQPAVIEVRRI